MSKTKIFFIIIAILFIGIPTMSDIYVAVWNSTIKFDTVEQKLERERIKLAEIELKNNKEITDGYFSIGKKILNDCLREVGVGYNKVASPEDIKKCKDIYLEFITSVGLEDLVNSTETTEDTNENGIK